VSNVEFEKRNDEIRDSDDAKSIQKYFGPEMEQTLRPDFSHGVASICDEK